MVHPGQYQSGQALPSNVFFPALSLSVSLSEGASVPEIAEVAERSPLCEAMKVNGTLNRQFD